MRERADRATKEWSFAVDELRRLEPIEGYPARILDERDDAMRERDAYKRAKKENDDRFQVERDEARAALRAAENARDKAIAADKHLRECLALAHSELMERGAIICGRCGLIMQRVAYKGGA